MDFEVDLPTITTQGCLASDVGQSKVLATASAINRLDESIDIQTVQNRYRPRPATCHANLCCTDFITVWAAIWRLLLVAAVGGRPPAGRHPPSAHRG